MDGDNGGGRRMVGLVRLQEFMRVNYPEATIRLQQKQRLEKVYSKYGIKEHPRELQSAHHNNNISLYDRLQLSAIDIQKKQTIPFEKPQTKGGQVFYVILDGDKEGQDKLQIQMEHLDFS